MSLDEIRDILQSKYPEMDAVVIRHDDLVFEERVRLKCLHCTNYREKWTCPGRLPDLDFRRIINEYEQLAVIVSRQPSVVSRQPSVVSSQQSAVSNQMSEIRNQKSEIRCQKSDFGKRRTDCIWRCCIWRASCSSAAMQWRRRLSVADVSCARAVVRKRVVRIPSRHVCLGMQRAAMW